jgi:hypothetical protein
VAVTHARASVAGRIFNVSRRAVGVVVNKRIKNRYLAKRINVRIEHIKHSTCRQDFLECVRSAFILPLKWELIEICVFPSTAASPRTMPPRVPPRPPVSSLRPPSAWYAFFF